MDERRAKDRSICAELLTLRWSDGERRRSEAVILEDISLGGVCLHAENAIPPETKVYLTYPFGKFKGKVKYCAPQEIGHILGIAFDDGYRWCKTHFEPSHLFEPQPEAAEATPEAAEQMVMKASEPY